MPELVVCWLLLRAELLELNAAHVCDLVLLMSLISYCERVPRNDRLLLALPLAILALGPHHFGLVPLAVSVFFLRDPVRFPFWLFVRVDCLRVGRGKGGGECTKQTASNLLFNRARGGNGDGNGLRCHRGDSTWLLRVSSHLISNWAPRFLGRTWSPNSNEVQRHRHSTSESDLR